MTRKIYFLGGKLLAGEDRLYEKYRRTLERTVGGYGSAEFKLIPVPDCTRARFKQIWQDRETYGIFWFGHGTPSGLPATNEPISGGQYQTLNPLTLPVSGANLQFLVLLSCFSGQYKDEWQRLMKRPAAKVETFPYIIEGHTGEGRSSIELWLDSRAGKVVQSAANEVERSEGYHPHQVISSDFFEPIVKYVPYRIIPKEEPKSKALRPSVLQRTKSPVPRPTPTVPVNNWGFQKRKNQWILGPRTGAGTGTGGGHTKAIQGPIKPKKPGVDLVSDIHSRFRPKEPWKPLKPPERRGTGVGARSWSGGTGNRPGAFGPSIENDIHSRFRPAPKRIPLGPPKPVQGDIRIESVTLTYSRQRRVFAPGPF